MSKTSFKLSLKPMRKIAQLSIEETKGEGGKTRFWTRK